MFLYLLSTVFESNKRPVNVFLCLQAACINTLVWFGFELATFSCVSLSNIQALRMRVKVSCLATTYLRFLNE